MLTCMFIIVVYLYTVLHIAVYLSDIYLTFIPEYLCSFRRAETLLLRDEDKEPQELGSMDHTATMGILIEVT